MQGPSIIYYMLREHRQKNFVTLSGFWPLRGLGGEGGEGGGWGNPLKKENSWRKSIFQIMLYEAIKLVKNDSVYMPNTVKN